ncbi:putative cDENN domain, tripartite DENN domain-containing protein [Plasmopara halstedii]
MSESEEDGSSISKQKSIFSGMGRVKQINHLREKWSPKHKSSLVDRCYVDTPPLYSSSNRSSRGKLPASDNKRHARRRSQFVSGSPRTQCAVNTLDMERYLAINTWLEDNGIDVAQSNRSKGYTDQISNDHELFDDMYCSLEVLEHNLQAELSDLDINDDCRGDSLTNEVRQDQTNVCTSGRPALFDYLAVIGPDMLDVKMHNFWNHRENVFEATVAFAYPTTSQLHAESLEHFCFPNGIESTNANVNASPNLEVGDFFVLLISGGGLQGQSVQYAMCMKATLSFQSGSDDESYWRLPICYCIIAQIPFIFFFRSVLRNLYEHLRNDLKLSAGSLPLSSIVTDNHAGFIDDILQHLQLVSLPEKGSSISVDVFPSPSLVLTLTRPHNEYDQDEKVALLLQWALSSLLSHLSIDRVLWILSLLLLETKLIVVSDDIPLLSSSTLGFASLLHPLVWAGPLISVLPPSMHEFMEAPVPFICGVTELPREFSCMKGTCILYITEDRVQRHIEDERAADSLRMPESENLSSDLTRFTKQMLGPISASTPPDVVTPLSVHLVINRVRRHIEHLISISTSTEEVHRARAKGNCLDISEMKFINEFIRTQMCQKYHDDQFVPPFVKNSSQQHPVLQTISDETLTTKFSVSTHKNGLKSASIELFQIAMGGVSTLPRSSSQSAENSYIIDSKVAIPNLVDPLQLSTLTDS